MRLPLFLALAAAMPANAGSLLGLTANGELITFDTASPAQLIRAVELSGVPPDERLVAIDQSPHSLEVFALARDEQGGPGKLYQLDPDTGVATLRALLSPAPGAPPDAAILEQSSFGADFDPASGLLRVVSSAGRNRRIQLETGAVIVDADLVPYPFGDPSFSVTPPAIVAIAHGPNLPGSDEATLWAIDADRRTLSRIGGADGVPSPDDGELRTVGTLAVALTGLAAFEIDAAGTAFAALQLETMAGPEDRSRLFLVNLATGEASEAGMIGPPSLGPLVALSAWDTGLAFASSIVNAPEGGMLELIVQRRGDPRTALSASWILSPGSAKPGLDYQEATGTLAFEPGERERSFVITTLSDFRAEGTEVFHAVLQMPSVGRIAAPSRARVRIVDDDFARAYVATADGTLRTVALTAPSLALEERALTGFVGDERVCGIDVRPRTHELFAVTDAARLYRVNRVSGAATLVGEGPFTLLTGGLCGVDFEPVTDRLRVLTEAGHNLRVHPDAGTAMDDTSPRYVDGDVASGEAPSIHALASTDASLSSSQTFGIDSARGTWVRLGALDGGPSAPSDGEVRTVGSLGLEAPLAGVSSLDFSTGTGSALALLRPADAPQASLFTVDPANGEAEPVGALNPSWDVAGFAVAHAPYFQFSADAVTVSEAEGVVRLTVVRQGSLSGVARVSWTTRDGTALAGKDFTGTSGTLQFNTGEFQKEVSVDVFADEQIESPETFEVVLLPEMGGSSESLGMPAIAHVTLNDFDAPPSLRISDTEATEQDGEARFEVRLNAAVGWTVRVNYATIDGTARAYDDFDPVRGTLSFAPGELRKFVVVPLVRTPADVEPIETFTVQLRTPGGAVLHDRDGVATIRESGAGAFALSLSSARVRAVELRSQLAVTVTPLSQAITSPVSLSCEGVPAGARCHFLPARVVPGGKPARAQLILAAEEALATASLPGGPWGLAFVFVPLAAFGARRRWRSGLVLLGAALVMATLPSCGSARSVSAGRHEITIVATGVDGARETALLTWIVE